RSTPTSGSRSRAPSRSPRRPSSWMANSSPPSRVTGSSASSSKSSRTTSRSATGRRRGHSAAPPFSRFVGGVAERPGFEASRRDVEGRAPALSCCASYTGAAEFPEQWSWRSIRRTPVSPWVPAGIIGYPGHKYPHSRKGAPPGTVPLTGPALPPELISAALRLCVRQDFRGTHPRRRCAGPIAFLESSARNTDCTPTHPKDGKDGAEGRMAEQGRTRAEAALDALARYREQRARDGGRRAEGAECLLQRALVSDTGEPKLRRRVELVERAVEEGWMDRETAGEVYDVAREEGLEPAFAFE